MVQGRASVYTEIYAQKKRYFYLERTIRTNLAEDDSGDGHDDNVVRSPNIQRTIRTTTGDSAVVFTLIEFVFFFR